MIGGGQASPAADPGVGGNGTGRTPVADRVARFAIAGMSDRQLTDLSAQRLLALSLSELHAVRDYYRSPTVRERRCDAGLDEAATDVELEMIAQTWSEHCKHKIFNATIEYHEGGRSETIRSLFDRCIRATTHAVDPGDGFLRSVFHDNSGVIEFDPETLLCFKAETHNSPSALDPYGGAITGIVGVNRDILGTGRGARPIFNTNVLCFAPPRMEEVPSGLLPPRAVLEECIAASSTAATSRASPRWPARCCSIPASSASRWCSAAPAASCRRACWERRPGKRSRAPATWR